MQPDDMLLRRALIVQSLRQFFISAGFLEVETPLLIPANAPEEHIDPVSCGNGFLQTSPEIAMKRLLCRGYDKLFQISRCWRSGERGSRHVPEFTMIEWYRANSSYLDLMRDCEELLIWLSVTCCHGKEPHYRGNRLLMTAPARRITVNQAFADYSPTLLADAIAEDTFDEIMVNRIEPSLPGNLPVFLIDYPAPMAALARKKPGDPSCAERFELYLGGLELANGFSELNDPEEQRDRFLRANEIRSERGLSPLPLPEPFLEELGNLPPSAGIALGVDRLVMLLTGAERIDEVLAFAPEAL